MFTHNQGQNMNAPLGSPLQQAVSNAISQVGSDLIRQGMVQYQANNIVTQLSNSMQNICNMIAREYPSNIDGQTVYNYVQQLGLQLAGQMNSNPQMGGGGSMGRHMGGVGSMGHHMGGSPGGFSMTAPGNSPMNNPSVFSLKKPQMNSPQMQPTNNEPTVTGMNRVDPAPAEKRAIPNELGKFTGAPLQYDFEEETDAGSKYSIKNILSVPKRIKIIESKQNTYYYNRALSHIPEASIYRTIDNYHQSASDPLKVGKWITLLCYKVFDLRHFRANSGGKIDTSPIEAENIGSIPPDTAIRRVLDSIGSLNHLVASAFGELLTEKMNDYLARFVRVESDISCDMKIKEFSDIALLPGIRDKVFRPLTSCDRYEQTIVWCFRKSLEDLLAISSTGFYDTDEIAPHLVSHPRFLIRTNDFCERGMDLTKPDLINTIKSKYTAFSRVGEVAFANFIPNNLDREINGHLISIGSPKNVLETIISRIWAVSNDIPEVLVLRDKESNASLKIKIGRTMDTNQLFYYKTEVNLKDGE